MYILPNKSTAIRKSYKMYRFIFVTLLVGGISTASIDLARCGTVCPIYCNQIQSEQHSEVCELQPIKAVCKQSVATLSWQSCSGAGSTFAVDYQKRYGDWTVWREGIVDTDGKENLNAEITNLEPGELYRFRVSHRDSVGYSDPVFADCIVEEDPAPDESAQTPTSVVAMAVLLTIVLVVCICLTVWTIRRRKRNDHQQDRREPSHSDTPTMPRNTEKSYQTLSLTRLNEENYENRDPPAVYQNTGARITPSEGAADPAYESLEELPVPRNGAHLVYENQAAV